MTNEELSRKLRSHAAELARTGDNLYRIRAFRQAAFAILRLREPIETILNRYGRAELARQAEIGASIAETLEEWVHGEPPPIPGTGTETRQCVMG